MNETDPRDPMDPRKAAAAALADFKSQEAERGEEQALRESDREKRKRLNKVLQWAVVVICLGIVGYQAPRLADALGGKKKPLRQGSLATDELTDQCIANLWKVSRRLQEGRPVGADLICPASKKPFEIVTTGDDVVARSPRPDLYGFREIRVSKKNPVPELIP